MYKPGATLKEKKEIFALVKSKLRIIRQCAIPYYAPVNNGIVDVLNKKLIPFSPDIVFTSKIHTNLNMQATNPLFRYQKIIPYGCRRLVYSSVPPLCAEY